MWCMYGCVWWWWVVCVCVCVCVVMLASRLTLTLHWCVNNRWRRVGLVGRRGSVVSVCAQSSGFCPSCGERALVCVCIVRVYVFLR
jgi:hypothetical protein